LDPTPIRAGRWRNPVVEPLVGVVLVDGGWKLLVPHGIGRDQVEPLKMPALIPEGGVVHRIPEGDLILHLVDGGVHPRHGERRWVNLLPVELQGSVAGGKLPVTVCLLPVGLKEPEVALDEKPGRSAAGIIRLHPWFWLE
jgi:hypothetical protein